MSPQLDTMSPQLDTMSPSENCSCSCDNDDDNIYISINDKQKQIEENYKPVCEEEEEEEEEDEEELIENLNNKLNKSYYSIVFIIILGFIIWIIALSLLLTNMSFMHPFAVVIAFLQLFGIPIPIGGPIITILIVLSTSSKYNNF